MNKIAYIFVPRKILLKRRTTKTSLYLDESLYTYNKKLDIIQFSALLGNKGIQCE